MARAGRLMAAGVLVLAACGGDTDDATERRNERIVKAGMITRDDVVEGFVPRPENNTRDDLLLRLLESREPCRGFHAFVDLFGDEGAAANRSSPEFRREIAQVSSSASVYDGRAAARRRIRSLQKPGFEDCLDSAFVEVAYAAKQTGELPADTRITATVAPSDFGDRSVAAETRTDFTVDGRAVTLHQRITAAQVGRATVTLEVLGTDPANLQAYTEATLPTLVDRMRAAGADRPA